MVLVQLINLTASYRYDHGLFFLRLSLHRKKTLIQCKEALNVFDLFGQTHLRTISTIPLSVGFL